MIRFRGSRRLILPSISSLTEGCVAYVGRPLDLRSASAWSESAADLRNNYPRSVDCQISGELFSPLVGSPRCRDGCQGGSRHLGEMASDDGPWQEVCVSVELFSNGRTTLFHRQGGEALAFHHLTGRARARTKLPLLFARLLLGTAASGPPAGVGLGAPRLPSGR